MINFRKKILNAQMQFFLFPLRNLRSFLEKIFPTNTRTLKMETMQLTTSTGCGNLYSPYTAHLVRQHDDEHQLETMEDFIADGLVVAGQWDYNEDNEHREIQIVNPQEIKDDGIVIDELLYTDDETKNYSNDRNNNTLADKNYNFDSTLFIFKYPFFIFVYIFILVFIIMRG